MEHILALYGLPYDPAYPVICFDERPCFLIGDTLLPVAMKPGKKRKQHYEYEKLGSCALLAAIEPLTGRRLGQVHPQRTKRGYSQFCQALAALYPDVIKLRLVQDVVGRTECQSAQDQGCFHKRASLTLRGRGWSGVLGPRLSTGKA